MVVSWREFYVPFFSRVERKSTCTKKEFEHERNDAEKKYVVHVLFVRVYGMQ